MSIINRLINKSRTLALRALNEFIPKDDNLMIFASLPDYSDNAKGLWEYVHKSTEFKTLWLVKDKEMVLKLQNQGIECYWESSWLGRRKLLSAKYISCTHSQFTNIKGRKQVVINLWHGMPLKAMGYLDVSCNEKSLKDFKMVSKKSDMMFATSSIMKHILVSCFRIDPRKVAITGQPRNDILFKPNNISMLNSIIGNIAGNYDKYILYCPTFRAGMGRLDGKKFEGNIFNFSDYDKEELDKILKSQNALLIAKLHPFEEKQYSETDLNLPENSVLVKSEAFNRNLMSIYDILSLFDILITDYSSIYFDYLLLDKPMIFASTDLNEYKDGRGLVFNDYNFWTPGPKVTTFSDFKTKLERCLYDKEFYSKERALINGLINECNNADASARVIQSIKSIKK